MDDYEYKFMMEYLKILNRNKNEKYFYDLLKSKDYDKINIYIKTHPDCINSKSVPIIKELNGDTHKERITPLLYAIQNKDDKLLKILIDNKVNLNEEFEYYNDYNINCINYLFLYYCSKTYLKKSLNPMFELLIQNYSNINQQFIFKNKRYNIIQFIIQLRISNYIDIDMCFNCINKIKSYYPKIVINEQDNKILNCLKNKVDFNKILKEFIDKIDIEILLYISKVYINDIIDIYNCQKVIFKNIFKSDNIETIINNINIMKILITNKEINKKELVNSFTSFILYCNVYDFIKISEDIIYFTINNNIFNINECFSDNFFGYIKRNEFIPTIINNTIKSSSNNFNKNYDIIKQYLLKYIKILKYYNLKNKDYQINIKTIFTMKLINYILINDINKDKLFIEQLFKEYKLMDIINNIDSFIYIFKLNNIIFYLKNDIIKYNNPIFKELILYVINTKQFMEAIKNNYIPIEVINNLDIFETIYTNDINLIDRIFEDVNYVNYFDLSFYKNDKFIQYLINLKNNRNRIYTLYKNNIINFDDIIKQITSNNIRNILSLESPIMSNDNIIKLVNYINTNNIIITNNNKPTFIEFINMYKLYKIGYNSVNIKIMMRHFYHLIDNNLMKRLLNEINVLDYKYFIQIKNNKYYQTDEFEVSFIHYIILTRQNQEIINICMDKFPELINDNNNKYKLYPIHCALLRNNYITYTNICIKLHKPVVDIPDKILLKNKINLKSIYKSIKEKPINEKINDDIVDIFGNNMLEFCLLNKCSINIIKILMFNYNYDVYKYHNGENIIIKAIRVENYEFIDVLKQLGYDVNIGIVRFIQSVTGLC